MERQAYIPSIATRKEILESFASAPFSKMLNEILEKECQTIQTKQRHCIDPSNTHSPSCREIRSIEEIERGRLMREIKGMEQFLL